MKQILKKRENRGQKSMQGHIFSAVDCNPCSGTPSWSYVTKKKTGHE